MILKGVYIVGGYPDMDTFEKCFNVIENSKLDFIEIGLPFSEPVADGEIIVKAIEVSLKNGTITENMLNFLEKNRNVKIKKYIMTYSNIIYGYGIEKFSDNFEGLINSVIIADLPNKMHEFFYKKNFNIPIIPFVTPESRKDDIEAIKSLKGDFIYFIAVRGITGSKTDVTNFAIKERIERIKRITGKKVIMGFGLKDKRDAQNALKISDGFVIGTEAVKRQNNLAEFEKFLKSISSF